MVLFRKCQEEEMSRADILTRLWYLETMGNSEGDFKLKHGCTDHDMADYDFIINRNGGAGEGERYNASLQHWKFLLVMNKMLFYLMEV